MKIVLMTDNKYPQKFLVNYLTARYDIELLIIEKKPIDRGSLKERILKRFKNKAEGIFFHDALRKSGRNYHKEVFKNKYFTFPPDLRKIEVDDIDNSYEYIKNIDIDLIIVFGTSLVSQKITNLAKYAINLHWGLSPYYKGWPCTSWALINWDIYNIGVTVHLLTSKIDYGKVIGQARPRISDDDNVTAIDMKLTVLGTEIISDALQEYKETGKITTYDYPDPINGRLYLGKYWNKYLARASRYLIAQNVIRKMKQKPLRNKLPIVNRKWHKKHQIEDELVSIITPLYNHEEYVIEAVESLLQQTYQNIEIIIIDDNSTDNSLKVVSERFGSDRRVRIYQNSQKIKKTSFSEMDINAGWSTRNEGLKYATGKWIMFHDSDDMMALNRIEILYKIARIINCVHINSDWIMLDKNVKGKYFNFFQYVNKIQKQLFLLPDYTRKMALQNEGYAYLRYPHFSSKIPFFVKTRFFEKVFYKKWDPYPALASSPLVRADVAKATLWRSLNNRVWPSKRGRGTDRDYNYNIAKQYHNSYVLRLPLYFWRVKNQNPAYISEKFQAFMSNDQININATTLLDYFRINYPDLIYHFYQD